MVESFLGSVDLSQTPGSVNVSSKGKLASLGIHAVGSQNPGWLEGGAVLVKMKMVVALPQPHPLACVFPPDSLPPRCVSLRWCLLAWSSAILGMDGGQDA